MIKTFRGLMSDLTQDTIVLHTNDGSTGYKIVKFELLQNKPGDQMVEGVVQIYTKEQTLASIDGFIDFSDQTLLGAGYYCQETGAANPVSMITVFDNMIFNQDIYITYKDMSTGIKMNYYIELEQIKLDIGENTVATLKDIRNLS